MKYLSHISRTLILTAAIFLSACATTTPYTAYNVERDELQQWFSSARNVVEHERGIKLDNVTLSTVSSREMLFVLSDLYGKKLDPNMTADTRIRVFSEKAFEDVQHVQAVYDPYAKRIVVNQQNMQRYIGLLQHRGVSARNAALTILIHELIHAADDKDYDLVAIEQRHKGDTLGVFMVAEGHAELQTETICAKAGCSAAFRTAQIEFHGVDPHDTDQSLLTSKNNNGLIYVQGRKFLKALAARDTDGSLVRQALNNPPGDVLEFFDPASFPDTSRSSRRKHVYEILESISLDSAEGPVLKIPAAVFNESQLPLNKQERIEYIRDYKRKTLASGSMSYVEQYDQDLSSVYVRLYETASPTAAIEIQQDLINDQRILAEELKKLGADIRKLNASELKSISGNIPAKTVRHVLNYRDRRTNETSQLITSFIIEGRYLIVVGNADDHTVNDEMLLKVLHKVNAS